MTIIREGVESIINPLDYVAIEGALDLRSRHGGEVSIITMGPPQSEAALREALAVGADRGILLSDPAFAGADTLATSHVLASAIKKIDPFPDLVLCGMQTIDSDTGHVGPQIAEELDLPQVCGVNEIHLEDGLLVVKCVGDGFLDTKKVTIPALLTVAKEFCAPKELPLGALEIAFSEREIIRWGIEDLGLREDEVGLKGSATHVWKLRPTPPKREGEFIRGSSQTLLESLLVKLEALGLLDEEGRNANE